MSNRRTIRVAAAALAVMMSTVVCELSASEVLDEPIRIQRTATREAQQTETTVAATKTTLVITPTITPTATLTVVPVSLPEFSSYQIHQMTLTFAANTHKRTTRRSRS